MGIEDAGEMKSPLFIHPDRGLLRGRLKSSIGNLASGAGSVERQASRLHRDLGGQDAHRPCSRDGCATF